MPQSIGHTTQLLKRAGAGDDQAASELLPLLYTELHALAAGLMSRERAQHTLQPTALVHEAFLKLVDGAAANANDERHFLALAARAMRQVLIDHARARATGKRGGGLLQIALDDALAALQTPQSAARELDMLQLDESLERLAREDDELARIVELRYFGGLTLEATADTLSKSRRQVERAWDVARAWLKRDMERGASQ